VLFLGLGFSIASPLLEIFLPTPLSNPLQSIAMSSSAPEINNMNKFKTVYIVGLICIERNCGPECVFLSFFSFLLFSALLYTGKNNPHMPWTRVYFSTVPPYSTSVNLFCTKQKHRQLGRTEPKLIDLQKNLSMPSLQ